MLTPTLRAILERAASEAAFRDQLLAKPDEALAEYSLTTEEAAALRTLSGHQLDELAADMSALDGELSEDALDQVAGGTRLYSAFCFISVSGAVGSRAASGGSATGGSIGSAGGTIQFGSDRDIKANFAEVEGLEVLERLVRLPISTWNYLAEDDAIRHIGPMAQDFRATFGVGQDDKTIQVVDANGVALAAIQGLYQILRAKDAQFAAQQAELAALQARLSSLEQKE